MGSFANTQSVIKAKTWRLIPSRWKNFAENIKQVKICDARRKKYELETKSLYFFLEDETKTNPESQKEQKGNNIYGDSNGDFGMLLDAVSHNFAEEECRSYFTGELNSGIDYKNLKQREVFVL